MSGPLSSNEIEDVVSSIRRLVSAEMRPRPAPRSQGEDKLILTPALRVVTDDAEAPMPAPPSAAKAEPDRPAEPESEAVSQIVDADWQDPIWQEEPTPLAELALGAEEAELVLPAEEEGPPLVEMAAEPVWEVPSEFEEDLPEAVIPEPQIAELAPGPRDAEVWAGVQEDIPADPATVEPEALVGQAERGRPTVFSSILDETQTLVDKDGNPLTVLDEEALQEIVRSIIREELQGVLGERITRNVRKLVRAEINRALAARALD
ncbi:hypothetical protein [Tabrizicola sp. YIM 78059]|uniref:hypothetical protein n=1 Tax=Tabrizicola sp. YIM 78059 TaxID=2529861 RepID=UPI0010AA3BB7|nr:hypothetical protein [Tabrizicola sp. YIM 78059]